MSLYGNTVGFASDMADNSLLKRVILPEGGKNLYNFDSVEPSSARCSVTKMTGAGDGWSTSLGIRSTTAEGSYHCAQQLTPFWLRAGVSYTMSVTLERLTSGVASFGFRNSVDNKLIGGRSVMTEVGKRYSLTYTPSEDVDAYFSVFVTDGTEGMMGDAAFRDIQVEVGSKATGYEPFYRSLAYLTTNVNNLSDLVDALLEG